MFIGDCKDFWSLLKIAGAVVLYGFLSTHEHLLEFGAKMSICNLTHFGILEFVTKNIKIAKYS